MHGHIVDPPPSPEGMGWWWQRAYVEAGCGAWAQQTAWEQASTAAHSSAQQRKARFFACLVVREEVVGGLGGACVAAPSVRMWLNEHAALTFQVPTQAPFEVSLTAWALLGMMMAMSMVPTDRSLFPHGDGTAPAILWRWIVVICHLAVAAAITAWVSLMDTQLRRPVCFDGGYHGRSVHNSHLHNQAPSQSSQGQSRPVRRIGGCRLRSSQTIGPTAV
jgi:hypothetical protein